MKFPYKERFEHCYIPGKTGHGKTTLLQNMALQDMKNGAGITFLDPGGDAVKELLHHIPEDRIDDVIYIDFNNVIPFQFFNFNSAVNSPFEKDELVKDMTFMLLKGIANAPSAENYIQRMCYTLLECTIPVCFLDAYYFLTKSRAPWSDSPSRFDEILAAVPEKWRTRWIADFPKSERLLPILIRLEPLASNHITEKLFGTLNPVLNIATAMNSRKIMLVDLGGAGSAKMEYGSLFFAKMKQEVFRRADIHKSKRIPHFVFIDEFETFADPQSFASTLKMARKYRLAMTLASLSYHELDAQLKTAIGIISNYIVFSLNPQDEPTFSKIIPAEYHESLNLSNLRKFSAIYKLGSEVKYQYTPKPLAEPTESYAQYIKKRTVDIYACNTAETPHDKGNGSKHDKPEEIGPDTTETDPEKKSG